MSKQERVVEINYANSLTSKVYLCEQHYKMRNDVLVWPASELEWKLCDRTDVEDSKNVLFNLC